MLADQIAVLISALIRYANWAEVHILGAAVYSFNAPRAPAP